MGWFDLGSKTKALVKDIPMVNVKERVKKVEISGHSRMTDPALFYEQLCKDLENQFYNFRHTLIIDFSFEYINSGSSKWLYHLLVHMQNLSLKKGLIEINWYYEEDDEVIYEAGEVLQSVLKIPFHIKQL